MMPMDYANSHTFKVVLTKEEMCANTHPFKVSLEGGGAEARIVDELPEEGEPGYIYLVLREETEEGNIYDEYMWVLQQDGKTYDWEKIGSTDAIPLILYDEPGTNTDGAMTQNATTRMVHPSGSTSYNIGIGRASAGDGISTIRIGVNSVASMGGIVLGNSATTGTGGSYSQFRYAMALGQGSDAGSGTGSVALGAYARTQRNGEVNIGSTNTNYGYNGTNYRVLGGVHDPINNQDAATKKYVDTAVASAGPTVVQTTGQSTTNVMSQKATTDMIFNPDNSAIQIGAIYADNDGVAIGDGSQHNDAVRCVTIGKNSYSSSDNGIAIGYNARTDNSAGIALGENSYADEVDNVLSIGNNDANHGTVFTRRIINVTDPEQDQDAATKKYVDSYFDTENGDFGILTYYPFTFEYVAQAPQVSPYVTINQTKLKNRVEEVWGKLINRVAFWREGDGLWAYVVGSTSTTYTIAQLTDIWGVTISDPTLPYNIIIDLCGNVDTSGQTSTMTIDTRTKYNSLGNNDTTQGYVYPELLIPKAAVYGYKFGEDSDYTPDYFLAYCPNIVDIDDSSNKLKTIGNYFIFQCHNFNGELKGGGSITTIGNYFLNYCESFNSPVFTTARYVAKIGDRFMEGCSGFVNKDIFQTKNSIEEIGGYFMTGCSSFTGASPRNQGFTFTKIKKIGDGFLNNCTSYNARLSISQADNAGVIGNYFMNGCSSFTYSNIRRIEVATVGDYFMSGCTGLLRFVSQMSGGITFEKVGSNFLSGCTSLNFQISLPKLREIANHFLSGCSSFNSTISLPVIEKIGQYFMYGCTAFNQNLSLATLRYVDIQGFMNNCNAMTGTVDLGLCYAPTADNLYAFSTSNSSAASYTTGITLYGVFVEDWIAILPNRDVSPYRKLINGGSPIGSGGEEISSADWADLWSGVIENVNGVGL